MFHRLKLQFIFTNLAIIGILFLLITGGVYFLVQTQMISHIKDFSTRMAAAINSGMIPDHPEPNGAPVHPPGPPAAFNNPGHAWGFFPNLPARVPRPGLQTSFPPMDSNPRPPFPRDHSSPPRLHFGIFPNFPKYNQLQPPVFFVKLNPQGKILTQAPEWRYSSNQLATLAQLSFRKKNVRGIVNNQNANYYYYKTPLKNQAGTLIVFMGLRPEEHGLRSLVISLIIIGILSLVFGLCGSLFMAGRAIRPIQEAWRQQKDFIADASHELRTPLSVIQTNLEVILSNPGETVASQMDWLQNIQDEAGQMADLIASLLFLARYDSNQWLMEQLPFDLRQAATRAFDAFKPVAAAQGIGLALEPDSAQILTAAPIVLGDESTIRRVMEILLDNAIRHTPAGGQITIQLRHDEKKVFVTVADTGEGIPAAHLDKIFDRFYQVDAARSNGKAGLGLSIAKCIIENHNGAIHVASTVGAGTVFTIQMPLAREEQHLMNREARRMV